MAWRGWLTAAALLGAALAFAPAAPAKPCAPTEIAQDDAGSGADAPDAPSDALLVRPQPGPGGDRVEDYYWAWLDPPGAPGADTHDWYAFETNGDPTTLMVGVTATNLSALSPTPLVMFTLRLYAPNGTLAGAATSYDDNVSVDGAPAGTWRIGVDTGGAQPCSSLAPSVGDPARLARNHGIYVGCRPVCVDAALDGST